MAACLADQSHDLHSGWLSGWIRQRGASWCHRGGGDLQEDWGRDVRAEGLTPFCRVSEAQHVSSLCASTWPGAEVGSPALSAQVGRSGLAGHATGGSAGPRWPVVSLVPPSKHLATCPHALRLRKSQTPQVQVLELPSTAKDQLVCTSAAGAIHWEVASMWHRRGIDVAAVVSPQWPPLQCSESQVDALPQPLTALFSICSRLRLSHGLGGYQEGSRHFDAIGCEARRVRAQ